MTELSQAILSGKVQPPGTRNPELSPQLEGIILKALSRNREQRYEDAALMARELRALNLQPPVQPAASLPPSLSLSEDQSKPSNGERYLSSRRPQPQGLPHIERALNQAPQTEVQPNKQQGSILNVSQISGALPHLIDQKLTEGTEEQIQQTPQQLVVSQPTTFSQPPEEIHAQDRQGVMDHIQRLFRFPSRKMPQSSNGTGKESATGT
jgi:hypothetical protein